MAIKYVTPKMTSYTTPEPYKVSCSYAYSDCEAWKAFNGTNADIDDCWRSPSNANVWIAIYLGSCFRVSGVELISPNRDNNCPFEEFEVYGSMDGVEWELMSRFDESISSAPNTKKTFNFGKTFYYSHYKINVPDAKGVTITIGEINFICDTDLKDGKLNFYKTLSKNVPSFLESKDDEVHFTEKGEIFSYDMFGNIIKLGGSESSVSRSEW